MDAAFAVTSFLATLTVVNPPGTVPTFIALCEGLDARARRELARNAAWTLGLVLGTFAVLGSALFTVFGFSPEAMRIAGGLLLFTVGFQMIRGGVPDRCPEDVQALEAQGTGLAGIVPMGMPVLAGPGSITAVLIASEGAPSNLDMALLLVGIAIIAGLTYLTMRGSSAIQRVLGQTGILATGRFMGLILAAIAVQLILDGLRLAFPGVTA